ncbi:MAG TPA: serine hydrolase [Polyangiales bacterium]|nr:serine hydrolase [Polyangiales bacterium]
MFTRVALGLAIAVALQGCVFDGELKHDLGTVPEALDDGWEIADPHDVGLSRSALARIHRELLREDRQLGTLGFLVVKDHKLVFETYLRSLGDRDHYHHIQSATKSVTSLAFGIARDDGDFDSLDLTTGALFPDAVRGLDPRAAQITLRQLLTMRSGLAFDNDVFSLEMWVDKPDDPLRYMLSKPFYADPGTEFYYRDVDPQLVGYALRERTQRSERELVEERIFDRLGIDDFYWESGSDGISLAAHGLHLRPRDLAKLGQLLLDRGTWNGERVVSEAWIDEATRRQATSETRDQNGKRYGYGYYFWILPDVGFAAWGHGGQFIVVAPAQQLVVVQVSLPDTDDLPGSHLNDVVELVQPLLE